MTLGRWLFSGAVIGAIAGAILGLVAHEDAQHQELIGVRYTCASDLTELLRNLSDRSSLAEAVARSTADPIAVHQNETATAASWNLVSASCYQLGILRASEDDPVGYALTSAEVSSTSALVKENDTLLKPNSPSTGSVLVTHSKYWAIAALAQVDAASPGAWWLPFQTAQLHPVTDFRFGCPVLADGHRADRSCAGMP